MNILFLDDQQLRHDIAERYFSPVHTLLHAFNPKEAITIIETYKQSIGLAMLDHDLNCFVSDAGIIVPFDYKDKKTELDGKWFIRTMIETVPQQKWPAYFIVHSHNDAGTKSMASLLNQANAYVSIRRFTENMIKRLVSELSKN